MIKWLPEILLAVAALIAGALMLMPRSTSRPLFPIDRQSEAMINHIVQNGGRDLAQERFVQKTNAARKLDLMNAVATTCLGKYQRDLCVVNLINCGPSCKALIPREQFPRIEADYWTMVDERHLRGRIKVRR